MYGLIYKITNLINEKVYIGQTTQTLKHRWSQHPYDSCCTHLYNSIKKYGKENFKIEQIDLADSIEELNKKEISWISYFQATNENFGYNIAPGGYKGRHSEETKKKLSLQKLGSKNPQYGKKQPKEVVEKRRKSMLGHVVSEETKNKIKESNTQKLEIYCHQTDTTYISISEAARQLNLTSGCICRVLSGKRTHIRGYTFKHVDKNLNVPLKKRLTSEQKSVILKNRKRVGKRKIKCIETSKEYNSITEACVDLEIKNSSLSDVLTGKNKTTKGYTFIYLD